MKTIELKCDWCGDQFVKELKEVTRQVKKDRKEFFCSLSCGAKKHNLKRKAPEIEKPCPVCSTVFKTRTNKSERTFCNNSCASMGSMTGARWESVRKFIASGKDNLISPEKTLRLREAWKYVDVKKFLDKLEKRYIFEYRIGSYIYDLALLDDKFLIEFDGPDHDSPCQSEADNLKDKYAHQNGWCVKRIAVDSNSKIILEANEFKPCGPVPS